MIEIHEAIKTIALDQVYDQVHVEQLMDALKLYPTYNSVTWDIERITKIEVSLSQVVEKKFAASLYQHLSVNKDGDACAALQLLKLLFELKYFKREAQTLDEIQSLIKQHPENRAYHYLFIKIVNANKDSDFELLLASQKLGCDLVMRCTSDSEEHYCMIIAINLSVRLFYKYISLHDFESASQLITDLDNVKPFLNDFVINNVLAGLPYALEQNQALYKLNETSLLDMEHKVNKLGEDNNKRSFEILIVFTAVITFLVTAAGSATSDNTTIAGLASLGLTLLVFVVSSLICLERPKSLYGDTRMIILALALLTTLIMVMVDKYEKFEFWSEKNIYIAFPQDAPKHTNTIVVPYRLE